MRILFIEDDKELCDSLRPALERAGFSVDCCFDGEDGLALLCEDYYSVCILDRMLPELDGLTLLRKARAKGIATPVLILTALGRVEDRVDGLEAGADDYLRKPFDTRELIARLDALMRRPAAANDQRMLSCGDVSLNLSELTLTGPQATVTLSKKECELMEALCKRPGVVQSRSVLIGRVWGSMADIEDTNLDTYIYFVRRRLSTVGSNNSISTVRGVGYRLEARDD